MLSSFESNIIILFSICKRIDELLEKQRQKRIKEREKYANSISSKKSKKSNKKGSNNQGDELQIIPPLPTLPVISNVNLYASEKTSQPWMYQQPEQQNSYYVENQPMTPLESAYSLQRNNTKYNPYNETPYISSQSGNYNQYKDVTNNYYYPSTQQQSSQYKNNSNNYPTSNTVYNTGNAVVVTGKPHEYDESFVTSPSQISGSTLIQNENYQNRYNKEPQQQIRQYYEGKHTNNTYDNRSNTTTTIPSTKISNDNINVFQPDTEGTRSDIYDTNNENSYQLQDYYHNQDYQSYHDSQRTTSFNATTVKEPVVTNQPLKYKNYI